MITSIGESEHPVIGFACRNFLYLSPGLNQPESLNHAIAENLPVRIHDHSTPADGTAERLSVFKTRYSLGSQQQPDQLYL